MAQNDSRPMRLLLIEDDPDEREILSDRLAAIKGVTVVCAESRDSAFLQLASGEFDAIVCDLKIPTGDGQLDAETEHGEAVIARVRKEHAGTPLVILSAYGTQDFALDVTEAAPKLDIVGDGTLDVLAVYRTKEAIDRPLDEIRNFAMRLSATDEIEIRKRGAGLELSSAEARVIRILARRCDGRVIEVYKMPGGLSGTSTFRMKITGRNGQGRGEAFVKVGPLALLKDESDRVKRYVTLMLPVGSFATLHDRVEGGAGPIGAISYQLAEGAQSMNEIIRAKPDASTSIVSTLAGYARRWHEGGQNREITVRELCDDLGAPDVKEVNSHLDGVDCDSITARTILIHQSVQHGDLHGDNVLIVPPDLPVLIDFGEVGDSFAGYDAVNLELGLLFHPSGVSLRGNWPSSEQVSQWDDLDFYLQQCPVPEFVRACRKWAFDVSPSDGAVYACVFAYALRQLKYPDTDKGLARELIRRIVQLLN